MRYAVYRSKSLGKLAEMFVKKHARSTIFCAWKRSRMARIITFYYRTTTHSRADDFTFAVLRRWFAGNPSAPHIAPLQSSCESGHILQIVQWGRRLVYQLNVARQVSVR